MKKKKSKLTRLFHGNQYVESFEIGEGKIKRMWRKTKLYGSFFLIAAVVAVEGVLLFYPDIAKTEPEIVERIVTVYEVSRGPDIGELQNEVMEELASCETKNIKEPDGAIILDTNKRMSIGRYMWQRESVILYYGELYNKEITRAEAIAISIDPERAGQLTRDVLFNTEDGWTNWYNCGKQISLAMKVGWIKKLTD